MYENVYKYLCGKGMYGDHAVITRYEQSLSRYSATGEVVGACVTTTSRASRKNKLFGVTGQEST